MRQVRMLLWASAALCGRSAIAADAVKFGAPPPWVHPQAIPDVKPTEAPVSLLLHDQQVRLEHGKVTTFTEGAMRIENGQGLAAGNVAFAWQPATDTITVNKLQIRRGAKVIDVLAGGQTFTVLRRETNLDAATLDGTLTATLQPEGLQVGDIIDLATTTERSDPVLKGHVETMFGAWDGYPIEAAHAALSWPGDVRLQLHQTPNLPAALKSSSNGMSVLELAAKDVQPLVPPKGAPQRFKIGRLAEATDFGSWADLATLFMPLFRDASAIPASGPLHDEVERIRSASRDPKSQATQALALVQDRVRYVALLMGQGGYVPATAETTWSRRFGDCKAKSALLLGILHSLGIQAEPVLVQSRAGDMIADRLPMVSLFDHVLVRAHIGGKDYWFDGTRSGDTDLDAIQVPDFGWGLPLLAGAKLVQMVPAPLTAPNVERHVSVDASNGVYAPATVTIYELHRGDGAVGLNAVYSGLTAEQRDEQMHDQAKSYFDSFASVSSSLQFDKAKRELRVTIKGTAKLNWKDSWFFVPISSLGFDPDFDRGAGPLHDVPWVVSHPTFVKDQVTIRLPAGFADKQKLNPPIHETLAGMEYLRTEAVSGDVLTVDSSERSVAPEVPYKDALAAAPRLRALDKDDVYLNVPTTYSPSERDVAALSESTPSSADDYFVRARAYFAHNKVDEAIADITKGLELEPNNAWALGERAWVYIQKKDFVSAERDLTATESFDPSSVGVIRIRAAMAERKGDPATALAGYNKALLLEPDNEFALTHRGLVLIILNKSEEALPDLDKAIAIDAKDPLALINRAMAELNLGSTDAADRDTRASLAAFPTYPAGLMMLGRIAEKRGDLAAAVEAYTKELAAENASPMYFAGEALEHRATAYFGAGKYDEALRDTAQALKLPHVSTAIRLLRANIFMVTGKRDAVPTEAEAMTRDNPTSDEAYVAAAKSYAAIGQREKAMQIFDRALGMKPTALIYVNRAQVRPPSDVAGQMADYDAALKLEPKMPEALVSKASLLSKQGRFTEALVIYDEMPRSGSNGLWLETERAVILSKAGRTADAGKDFAALRAKAKSASDLNSLCWAEGTAGLMVKDAVQECREAVKMSNRNPQYIDSLGMALLKSGNLDEALAAYDESIEKGHLPASYMGRAIIHSRRGDAAHAEEDLAQAKKLDPGIEDRFAEYGLKFDGLQAGKPGTPVTGQARTVSHRH